MNKQNTLRLCAIGMVTTLTSCTELTRLGVSGELSSVKNGDSAVAAARHFTKLAVATNEWMVPNSKLGDVDGDGLDDVIVLVTSRDQGPPGQRADMTAHLFYGRAGLPEQLSLADADATFATQLFETVSLGDVNGDKLADFVLGDGTGIEFVFGSAKRWSGHYPKFSAGQRWAYGGPPPDGGFLPLSLGRVFGLGDLNGDGADEFLLEAVLPEPTSQNAVRVRSYLMAGRKGDWPTGTWDPSWAAAIFGEDQPASQLWFPTSGDVDGDGYKDLVVSQDERLWLFYGGPNGVGREGKVTTAMADAELKLLPPVDDAAAIEGGYSGPSLVGDIDGDGTDDFLVRQIRAESQITYSSSKRLSGVVALEPDLIFADHDAYVVVGDINADGHNDLLVQAVPFTGAPTTVPVLYELRGTDTRLTGRKALQLEEIYKPVGYAAPDLTHSNIMNYGDIDGDGSADLAAFQYADTLQETELPEVTLFLLPGSTPEPE